MNHTLNTPSASWSVARFPKEVQNYAPTVKEPAMFSALRNGGGNVALNAYAAQAVVAWMKGEHADMALVDVGGSTYAAELPQADGTALIATVNRPDPNGKTVRLRAAIAKPVVGTSDYTFTSLPTIDRNCEVNLFAYLSVPAAYCRFHLGRCGSGPQHYHAAVYRKNAFLTRVVSVASATRWW